MSRESVSGRRTETHNKSLVSTLAPRGYAVGWLWLAASAAAIAEALAAHSPASAATLAAGRSGTVVFHGPAALALTAASATTCASQPSELQSHSGLEAAEASGGAPVMAAPAALRRAAKSPRAASARRQHTRRRPPYPGAAVLSSTEDSTFSLPTTPISPPSRSRFTREALASRASPCAAAAATRSVMPAALPPRAEYSAGAAEPRTSFPSPAPPFTPAVPTLSHASPPKSRSTGAVPGGWITTTTNK